MAAPRATGAPLFYAEFVVVGTPVAQPRHRDRIAGANGKQFVQHYAASSDHAIHMWRLAVRQAALQHRPAEPMRGPVSVTWDMRFSCPKDNIRHPRGQGARIKCEWHTRKPDRDNLDKPILDELKAAGFYLDDNQVCSGGPNTKRYVLPGENAGPEGLPGVTIVVEELER
jgi:Holliday junction resolvase RusA-like endonuclease